MRRLRLLLHHRRPWRFLISRLLRYSGLCRFVTIRRGRHKLHFYPTGISADYWLFTAPTDDEQLLSLLLRPGDRVIDVGANIGGLTVHAATLVGPSGAVLSCEPHPRVFAWLTGNVALNALTNVRLCNVACGAEPGEVRFTDANEDSVNHVAEDGGLCVPVVTLDSLADDDAPITLLKIDVEGFELPVLRGAGQTLARTRFVYLEALDRHFTRYGYHAADVVALLRDHGFAVMTGEGDQWRPLAADEAVGDDAHADLLAVRDEADLAQRLAGR